MGLNEVVGEVRRDGEAKAQAILQEGRQEAQAILAEARKAAKAYEDERLREAAREAAQVQAQAASRAESEARKAVLTAEAALRAELRQAVLAHFAKLPAKARQSHLKALVERARAVVPSGKAWCAEADAASLKAEKAYAFAGTLPMAGGLVVESEDGLVRLDLSYETLLEEVWRDVLKAEANLFR